MENLHPNSFKDDKGQSNTQSTITLTKETIEEHKHRDGSHLTSTPGAFVHLLKSSLGTGLLAMPAAFKQTGIIPGCIGTVLVGIIATHCVHILVSTSRAMCKKEHIDCLNYTDTCEKVFQHGPVSLRPFSKHVRYFADYSMAGVCLGGTSVYVIFIASSIKDLSDYFMPEKQLQVEIYCFILLLPLILITQIRYLKFLVPFSIFANVCLFFTICVTCYYTFIDTHIAEAKLYVSVGQWPLFLSTAIFAMEGINIVMPVENEMKNPEQFLGGFGVLNSTMILVTILYGIVGFLGYAKYGDQVLGSVTLNLPQNEMLALSTKILVATAVFFTYCLQMYAPLDIIWLRIKAKISDKYHCRGQILLRMLCVTLTVILAAVVPDLELLIGLVGAIFFSTLGLFIPTIAQTVHKWDDGLGKYNYILWKNIMLLLFYVIVLCSGCYSAVNEIIKKLTYVFVLIDSTEKN